jgi:single-strand DNA-binding protein
MAGSLNKVMLIGRLGKDPELKYTAGGTAVATFTMATDESYKDREGQKQERTEWHRIVVWSKQAEMVANYLSKGRLCYVEGRLQTRDWEDQNGQKRYTTEIVANTVQFLDSKGSAPGREDQSYEDDQRPRQGAQGGGQGQGGGNRGPQQKPAPARKRDDEDLGPAFPSEASGMDDVPF